MTHNTVLILCTGNSCRSQMAEALINHDRGDRWRAESAGTRPAGYVHPMALHVLRELGIALPHARSKSTDEFAGRIFDLALTVCDAAAEECPLWLGARGWAHISFPDPARATGTKAEQLAVFRQVRDDIRRTLIDHLDHWQG
jgi:arsenate reductase